MAALCQVWTVSILDVDLTVVVVFPTYWISEGMGPVIPTKVRIGQLDWSDYAFISKHMPKRCAYYLFSLLTVYLTATIERKIRERPTKAGLASLHLRFVPNHWDALEFLHISHPLLFPLDHIAGSIDVPHAVLETWIVQWTQNSGSEWFPSYRHC